jgi:hypothetical protein
MRIFARNILAGLNYTYTAELLSVMTKALGPRFERVSANWNAQGSEAIVLDTEGQMEYVVTVTPRRRPENVTVQ